MFILLIVLMICSGATEQIMAQWSSYYAEIGLGVSKIIGDLLGPLIFALTMALGRTFYGILGQKLRISRTLVYFSCISALCLVVAAMTKIPVVSLIAMGASGVGISLLWPGVLSISKEKYKGSGASMFAFLAFGGDIGCSVGPFLCGFVSDCFSGSDSLSIGILSGVIFPLIMVAGLIVIRKKASK